MKILLSGDVMFAKGLTYKQGNKALKKAREIGELKDWNFEIHLENGKWDLWGRHTPTIKAFIKNPTAFLIEV